jgi:phosphatidylinositol-3-phosphatase
MLPMRQPFLVVCALLVFAAPAEARSSSATPPVRHVFILMLENENAATTFGPGSPAPYLSQTLPTQGAFLPEYYGVTHLSLGNYSPS